MAQFSFKILLLKVLINKKCFPTVFQNGVIAKLKLGKRKPIED